MCARSASSRGRGHRVHQARLAQLAREAGRTTVQHIAGYERQRRHATLVAISLDLSASLTDQAIDLFDRLVGAMFRKAEGRHARAFQADARAINEKVRLYARVGAALIAAREGKQDAYRRDRRGDPLGAVPRDRRRSRGAGAAGGVRCLPESSASTMPASGAGRPAFLEAFAFEGVPASRLADARDRGAARGEPHGQRPPCRNPRRPASSGSAGRAYVLPGGGTIDRRYYELCVLSELRDRLRAGDVWVAGSRQYRSFEERLISQETLRELQAERHLAGRGRRRLRALHRRAARACSTSGWRRSSASAKDGMLPDVTIDKGVLKIAPIEKSTPPEAEALAARLYAMLPRIRITDLLAEVAGWTLFPDCFTHLRTGETAADSRILMAGLLADGLNLGLTRMAEACSIASLGQLAWTADWHIRDETYALALRRLVNQQQREPFAAHVRQRHRLVIGRPVLPGRAASAATQRASTPITARSPASRSTRTSPTATRRSTPS